MLKLAQPALTCLLLLPAAAIAQEWTPRFDLLTAGAAASVIAHQICEGSNAGKEAAASASRRLQMEANMAARYGVSPMQAYEYASDAYSMKIKAMWQANSELGCRQLDRLRSLASSTGFSHP